MRFRAWFFVLPMFIAACPDEALEGADAQNGVDGGGAIDSDVDPEDGGSLDVELIDGAPIIDAGFDPDCVACRGDGEPCVHSLNCQPGSICNTIEDELHDPLLPEGVCIRVLCGQDTDCTPPQTCSLEGTCRTPPCQRDEDCPANTVCRGGECTAPPEPVQAIDCNVLTDRTTLLSGERRRLVGISRNANGVPLVGLPLEWTSSDPRVIRVEGQTAIGGRIRGLATLTARVAGNIGVVCNGQAQIVNLTERTAGTTRIALISNDTGGPVLAAVHLQTMTASGAVVRNTWTSTLGEAVFNGEDEALSVVVNQRPSFDSLAVLAPNTRDLLLVVRRARPRNLQGGLRGMISGAEVRRRDLHQAIAGTGLRKELSDFGLRRMLCNTIDARVDAPELGIQDTISIPGNTIIGLGSGRLYTDDSNGDQLRCPDGAPAADQLGCYNVQTERGHNTLWALAGSFRLADATRFAVLANEPSFFCGQTTELPLGFPWLFRTMAHGVNPRADVLGEIEKVNRPGEVGKCSNPNLSDYDRICRADYARFNRSDLIVREDLGILSRVRVPRLPARGDSDACLDETFVIAGVELPERGLVPIGFGAGVDRDDRGETDCVAELPRGLEPFGPSSAALEPGVLPLWTAPKHSGLEDEAGITIASLAFGTPTAEDAPLSMSARFLRVPSIDENTAIDGEYLPLPAAEADLTTGALTLAAPPPAEATYHRLELALPDATTIVFAPASMDRITLPNVPGLAAALGPSTKAIVEVGETTASYDALFTFGTGTSQHRWIEQMTAMSVEECRAANSGCITR